MKPNRLASGTSLWLWESAGWVYNGIILALWLTCLILSFAGKEKLKVIARGLVANLIVIMTALLAGSTASNIVATSTPLTRVAISSGVWTSLAGAYMVIFASRQRLAGSPLWQNLVSWVGLASFLGLLFSGWLGNISIMQELNGQQVRFHQELINHLVLFSGSVAIGILIGIPLGIWSTRSRRAERPIFFIAGIAQTIPSLALFGLLIAPLSALSFAFPALREFGIRGIGNTPAIIALVIYSLLPIVQNTYSGLRQVDKAMVDAGLGMGMSRTQVFRRIEAPLAAPLVIEGVRTASVQAVGNTAVAALIGAGGLGWFVFQGMGESAPDLILLGAMPIIALAIVVDIIMRAFARMLTPSSLRGRV